jgi:hypothetical protein
MKERKTLMAADAVNFGEKKIGTYSKHFVSSINLGFKAMQNYFTIDLQVFG